MSRLRMKEEFPGNVAVAVMIIFSVLFVYECLSYDSLTNLTDFSVRIDNWIDYHLNNILGFFENLF